LKELIDSFGADKSEPTKPTILSPIPEEKEQSQEHFLSLTPEQEKKLKAYEKYKKAVEKLEIKDDYLENDCELLEKKLGVLTLARLLAQSRKLRRVEKANNDYKEEIGEKSKEFEEKLINSTDQINRWTNVSNEYLIKLKEVEKEVKRLKEEDQQTIIELRTNKH
jgi:hypothetical protein